MNNAPSKMTLALIHYLVQTFGGCTPDESGDPFHQWSLRVDDQTPSDRSKDFCNLTLVLVNGVLMLHLYRLPLDEHVQMCLASLKGAGEATPDGDRLSIPINSTSGRRLKRLAKVVRQVAGRGRRYSNPNWIWVTQRASASILKLAEAVEEFSTLIAV